LSRLKSYFLLRSPDFVVIALSLNWPGTLNQGKKYMAKLPLVLVPGLLCDKEAWESQIKYLRDIAEITVADLTNAATPDAMVAAVLAAAPAPDFCLAGHSMGAWVAVETAIQYPERVMKLCLISTNVDIDTKVKAAFRKDLIKKATQGEMDSVLDQLSHLFAANSAESIQSQIRKMMYRNAKAFISQENAMLMRRNCLPLLDSIKCPTLLIHSDKDSVFPVKDAQIIQEHIPQSKLAIVKDSNHMVTMEKPQEISELMRIWLMT
jgi:pimeloyl-ACP methyl ester carboxylesterase